MMPELGRKVWNCPGRINEQPGVYILHVYIHIEDAHGASTAAPYISSTLWTGVSVLQKQFCRQEIRAQQSCD